MLQKYLPLKEEIRDQEEVFFFLLFKQNTFVKVYQEDKPKISRRKELIKIKDEVKTIRTDRTERVSEMQLAL